MKRTLKFRFVLEKAYFDKGWGLLSYFKYVIALVGLGSLLAGYDMASVVLGAFIYGVVCYVLGRVWIRYKFYEEEQEVSNIFNKFVRETRDFINNKR